MINNQNEEKWKSQYILVLGGCIHGILTGGAQFIYFLTYLSVKKKNTSHFPATTATLVADNGSHEKFYNGGKSSSFYHIMPQTEKDLLFTTQKILFLSISFADLT